MGRDTCLSCQALLFCCGMLSAGLHQAQRMPANKGSDIDASVVHVDKTEVAGTAVAET